jgi:hypothetical protein
MLYPALHLIYSANWLICTSENYIIDSTDLLLGKEGL